MYLHQIAEFAGFVSAHGPFLIRRKQPVRDFAVQQYWRKMRSRQQVWLRMFSANISRGEQPDNDEIRRHNARLTTLCEEIFASELLTNVWSAVLVAVDEQNNESKCSPIARNVRIGQMQASRQALEWMLDVNRLTPGQLARLDGIRRRTERWCDFLLANLVDYVEVGEFCFDRERVEDFRDDQFDADHADSPLPVWNFIMAGLRLAFLPKETTPQPASEEYVSILSAILACFPKETLQTDGPFRSLLASRIARSRLLPEEPAREQNVLRWLSDSITP